jgi:hypothetical protein
LQFFKIAGVGVDLGHFEKKEMLLMLL